MKNFIKFIGYTLDNGNIITLLAVIIFSYLFGVSVENMAQFGATVGNVGFALISLLCSVIFVVIGIYIAVNDLHDFKGEEYHRRMECLINSGEWAKI